MKAGQAVMINWSDVAPEHRAAYYEWHSREHMVGRVSIRGFIRGRRYIAAKASRNFLVCYEVENIGVLSGPDYLAKADKPSELTKRTTPYVKNSNRAMAVVRSSHGIGTGGHALTLRFDAESGSGQELGAYLEEKALPQLGANPEIAGAHWFLADQEVSGIVPEERKGRPTVIPSWIVMVEGISLEAVSQAADRFLSDKLLRANGAYGGIARDTYSLQILVNN